jgi:prophage regulatory protein
MSKIIGLKKHAATRNKGKTPNDSPELQEIIDDCQSVKNENFLRLPSVKIKLALAPSTLWKNVRNGTLVPPIRINPRAVAWRESELNAMIAAQTYASRSGEQVDMFAFVSALIASSCSSAVCNRNIPRIDDTTKK